MGWHKPKDATSQPQHQQDANEADTGVAHDLATGYRWPTSTNIRHSPCWPRLPHAEKKALNKMTGPSSRRPERSHRNRARAQTGCRGGTSTASRHLSRTEKIVPTASHRRAVYSAMAKAKSPVRELHLTAPTITISQTDSSSKRPGKYTTEPK